jgi:hypothetical protein
VKNRTILTALICSKLHKQDLEGNMSKKQIRKVQQRTREYVRKMQRIRKQKR